MEGFFALVRHRRRLVFIYLSTLFLSFHYFITVYVNSSFLSIYFTEQTLSLLYITGSLLTAAILMAFPVLLKRFGNDRLLLFLTALELLIVFSLSGLRDPALILVIFILHQALPPLILFTLDVFLENTPHAESKTGRLRGLFLTVMNVSLVIAPLLVGITALEHDYSHTYLLAALFLIPLLFLGFSKTLRGFRDPRYRAFNIGKTALAFWKNHNLRNVFMGNFLLQIFYAWMVIYTPLYLLETGLTWQQMGIIFTFMLLPFVLFELPIAQLADKKYGEKEFMIAGFILLSFATASISFIGNPSPLIFAIALFLTRTGASFIEITTESYFFKKVVGQDADLISFFRMTRPLSFVIGPALAIPILALTGLSGAFVVFAVILSSGIGFSLALKDSR